MKHTIGTTTLALVRGDIVDQRVDAIVNAANPELAGGGGVDGAIHRAAGPSLLEECRAIIAEQGPCKAGDAVVTGPGALAVRGVIHAVGPIWVDGQHGEFVRLERVWERSLELARENGFRSVAFPSISTGAYGFPIVSAALVALNTIARVVLEHPDALDEVRVVLFGDADFAVYAQRFDEVIRTQIGTPK